MKTEYEEIVDEINGKKASRWPPILALCASSAIAVAIIATILHHAGAF